MEVGFEPSPFNVKIASPDQHDAATDGLMGSSSFLPQDHTPAFSCARSAFTARAKDVFPGLV